MNSTNPKPNISSYPSASHTTANDPTFSSTSAGNPDLGILSPSTSCRHYTSIDHKGVKTIQLQKLVLALLANPPAHSTAFAFLKSWPASSLLVADMGATDHMIPHKLAFISYKPATGRRVRMGNNSFAPILGTGSAIISINGKLILTRNCLHVPALRNPLYSLCAHQRQHRCGHIGMHQLGMFVFFPSFIIKVNTDTDCHLSYEPIGRSASIAKLDYVQPIQAPSPSASTTVAMTPSAPAVVKDEDDNDNVMRTYAAHWPKRPSAPPTPPFNMSLIPPLALLTRLRDLDHDNLTRHIYSLEHATVSTPDSHDNNSTPPADTTKVQSAPKELDCMSESEIQAYLHHPESRFPPIRPCDTLNASDSKTVFTPEELHRLTGCRWFRNYQHIISTSNGGILCNTGKFPLSLGAYATIPKAARGKPIDQLPSKYFDIVHVDIAFGDCVSVGGYKFALVFVDRATRYNWTFGLMSLQHSDIQAAFLAFRAKAGSFACQFCCDCNEKLLGSAVRSFLHTNNSSIAAMAGGATIFQRLSGIPLENHGPHVQGISHQKANAPDILVLCHQACGSDDEHDPREISRETCISLHAHPWCTPRSKNLASSLLALLLSSREGQQRLGF